MKKNIWNNFIKGEKFELHHYLTYLFHKYQEKESSKIEKEEGILTIQSLSRDY